MAKWFATSNVNWFRRQAEDCLIEEKKLQRSQDKEESAATFWARMERAGLPGHKTSKLLPVEIERGKESDYCPKSRWRYEWEQMRKEMRLASSNAKYRVDCAQWRREVRVALANARRRARELEEAAAEAEEAEAREAKKAEEPKIKG